VAAACRDHGTGRMKTSTVNGLKNDADTVTLTKACHDGKLPWQQSAAPRRTTRTPRQPVPRAAHQHRDRGQNVPRTLQRPEKPTLTRPSGSLHQISNSGPRQLSMGSRRHRHLLRVHTHHRPANTHSLANTR
jgi:hypothetical protein